MLLRKFQRWQLELLSSVLTMWEVFWGTVRHAGYWSQLTEEEHQWTIELICEYHADAQFLATLYACARLSELPQQSTVRIKLRDQWRRMLVDTPFPISALEYTWRLVAREQPYDPPRPPAICATLARLAEFESRESFLRMLEQQYAASEHSCHFERLAVYREALSRKTFVECLCVPAKSWLGDASTALNLLQRWMRAEPSLDYYRIHAPEAKQIIFFDVHDQQGTYWDKEHSGLPFDFRQITPLQLSWDPALKQLNSLADSLDQDLTLPLPALELSTSRLATVDSLYKIRENAL